MGTDYGNSREARINRQKGKKTAIELAENFIKEFSKFKEEWGPNTRKMMGTWFWKEAGYNSLLTLDKLMDNEVNDVMKLAFKRKIMKIYEIGKYLLNDVDKGLKKKADKLIEKIEGK
jgi:hypothetical protein